MGASTVARIESSPSRAALERELVALAVELMPAVGGPRVVIELPGGAAGVELSRVTGSRVSLFPVWRGGAYWLRGDSARADGRGAMVPVSALEGDGLEGLHPMGVVAARAARLAGGAA